jgi:hypothetical protein
VHVTSISTIQEIPKRLVKLALFETIPILTRELEEEDDDDDDDDDGEELAWGRGKTRTFLFS